MPKKTTSPFAHHALERICERYGIRLTRKQQLAFGQALCNPKYTIPLTRNRLACYFQGKWYLLACTKPPHTMSSRTMPYMVTVQTFLRLEDANDDDKQILRHDKWYLKINNDAFHVLSALCPKTTAPLPQASKTVELPDLTDDELPSDMIQSAKDMLNAYCDEVCSYQ